ncbi:MAG TPA: excalibur calcium-binding domain-containing protein [Nocardioidaceae bacterium]|nr:excalibur calcium-binding domain-containing protein [Nocardioidaceae bacterium]
MKLNAAEKKALLSRASHCANTVLTVRRASIVTASASDSGGITSGPNDPRFSYCYQAASAGYGRYYRGRDPEYWWYIDGDADGVVCES